MKICIFGETKDLDVSLYKKLCARILGEHFNITDINFVDTAFDPGSKGKLLKQICFQIDLTAEANVDLDAIFIFTDSDDKKYHVQKNEILKLIETRVRHFPHDAIIVATPQRNIEAWLLSDIGNINRIIGKSIKEFPPAEKIEDPKGHFKTLWGSTGKTVKYSSFALKIATSMNLKTVYKKSKAFSAFHNDLVRFMDQFLLRKENEVYS